MKKIYPPAARKNDPIGLGVKKPMSITLSATKKSSPSSSSKNSSSSSMSNESMGNDPDDKESSVSSTHSSTRSYTTLITGTEAPNFSDEQIRLIYLEFASTPVISSLPNARIKSTRNAFLQFLRSFLAFIGISKKYPFTDTITSSTRLLHGKEKDFFPGGEKDYQKFLELRKSICGVSEGFSDNIGCWYTRHRTCAKHALVWGPNLDHTMAGHSRAYFPYIKLLLKHSLIIDREAVSNYYHLIDYDV